MCLHCDVEMSYTQYLLQCILCLQTANNCGMCCIFDGHLLLFSIKVILSHIHVSQTPVPWTPGSLQTWPPQTPSPSTHLHSSTLRPLITDLLHLFTVPHTPYLKTLCFSVYLWSIVPCLCHQFIPSLCSLFKLLWVLTLFCTLTLIPAFASKYTVCPGLSKLHRRKLLSEAWISKNDGVNGKSKNGEGWIQPCAVITQIWSDTIVLFSPPHHHSHATTTGRMKKQRLLAVKLLI